MALVMLVFSVSPILAPLAGSALIVPFGWRAVFVAAILFAGLALVLTATLLPETRLRKDRVPVGIGSLLEGFGVLLRNGRFLGLTFIGGFGLGACSPSWRALHSFTSIISDLRRRNTASPFQ